MMRSLSQFFNHSVVSPVDRRSANQQKASIAFPYTPYDGYSLADSISLLLSKLWSPFWYSQGPGLVAKWKLGCHPWICDNKPPVDIWLKEKPNDNEQSNEPLGILCTWSTATKWCEADLAKSYKAVHFLILISVATFTPPSPEPYLT